MVPVKVEMLSPRMETFLPCRETVAGAAAGTAAVCAAASAGTTCAAGAACTAVSAGAVCTAAVCAASAAWAFRAGMPKDRDSANATAGREHFSNFFICKNSFSYDSFPHGIISKRSLSRILEG